MITCDKNIKSGRMTQQPKEKVIEAILAEARYHIASTKQDVCFFRDMKPPVHSMRVRECKNPMFLIVNKESRILSPIQISIIASVLRPNVPNTPIFSVDQPPN